MREVRAHPNSGPIATSVGRNLRAAKLRNNSSNVLPHRAGCAKCRIERRECIGLVVFGAGPRYEGCGRARGKNAAPRLGVDMGPINAALRPRLKAHRRCRASGRSCPLSVVSCQGKAKDYAAKIRPDGTPNSRLFFVGRIAGWARAKGPTFAKIRQMQAMG